MYCSIARNSKRHESLGPISRRLFLNHGSAMQWSATHPRRNDKLFIYRDGTDSEIDCKVTCARCRTVSVRYYYVSKKLGRKIKNMYVLIHE